MKSLRKGCPDPYMCIESLLNHVHLSRSLDLLEVVKIGTRLLGLSKGHVLNRPPLVLQTDATAWTSLQIYYTLQRKAQQLKDHFRSTWKGSPIVLIEHPKLI